MSLCAREIKYQFLPYPFVVGQLVSYTYYSEFSGNSVLSSSTPNKLEQVVCGEVAQKPLLLYSFPKNHGY